MIVAASRPYGGVGAAHGNVGLANGRPPPLPPPPSLLRELSTTSTTYAALLELDEEDPVKSGSKPRGSVLPVGGLLSSRRVLGSMRIAFASFDSEIPTSWTGFFPVTVPTASNNRLPPSKVHKECLALISVFESAGFCANAVLHSTATMATVIQTITNLLIFAFLQLTGFLFTARV